MFAGEFFVGALPPPALLNLRPFYSLSGQPLTKQVSHSLITPSNILEYNRFFKQSSNREDGWADVKIDRETTWRRMWFVFDDSVLKYGPGPHAPESSFVPIPMDNVMSLRADVSFVFLFVTCNTVTDNNLPCDTFCYRTRTAPFKLPQTHTSSICVSRTKQR